MLSSVRRWVQLVALLVAEIILCCKEVNTKTRATAYELLVDIAHAMHDARPPPITIPGEDAMGAHPNAIQCADYSPSITSTMLFGA